jgi:hypothetical protein
MQPWTIQQLSNVHRRDLAVTASRRQSARSSLADRRRGGAPTVCGPTLALAPQPSVRSMRSWAASADQVATPPAA